MNIHRTNSTTQQESKLAATLTSLAHEMGSNTETQETKPSPRRAIPIALSTVALATTITIAAAIYQPGIFEPMKDIALSLTRAQDITTPNIIVSHEQQIVPSPKPIITAPLREVTGSGIVIAPRRTHVFSKYEGQIISINIAPGDVVKSGQPLITLNDVGAHFALEQAKAKRTSAKLVLAASRIDLKQTRQTLDRIKVLAANNTVSQQKLDDTQAATDRALNARDQAQLAAANTELAIRIAEERLAELTVRAPFSGTITQLNAHISDTVLERADSARANQSLLTISDTQHMVIDADVAEANSNGLRPGLTGEAVLDSFPGLPFNIKILRLAPIVSKEKGTITLRLSLTNPPKGIRPNMAARIRITLPSDTKKTNANGDKN